MSFQDLNNVFGGNDAPTSTARILESIIRPTSTLEGGRKVGIEQATAIIRVVFNGSLDQFFGIHRWPTMMPEYKEIEITRATKEILQYTFGREVCRAPPLLIRRYPQAKDHDDLCQRAQASISRTQTEGDNTSPVVLEEELSIWLLVRVLYCAAMVRDAPMEQISEERRASRIDFVCRLEASARSIHYYMFCSKDREIRAVRTARAVDFAKIWTTINEEIRSMIMGWLEGGDELGSIELLGTDRRTQIPLTQSRADAFQVHFLSFSQFTANAGTDVYSWVEFITKARTKTLHHPDILSIVCRQPPFSQPPDPFLHHSSFDLLPGYRTIRRQRSHDPLGIHYETLPRRSRPTRVGGFDRHAGMVF